MNIKEKFDKKTYQRRNICSNLILNNHWEKLYEQTCAEGQFTIFTDIIESAIKKALRKKFFFSKREM